MSRKLIALLLFAGFDVSCPQVDAGQDRPPCRFLCCDDDYWFPSNSLGLGGEAGKIGGDHRDLAPLALKMTSGQILVRQLLRDVSLQLCQERLIARSRLRKFFPSADNPRDIASRHFGTRKPRDHFV